MKRSGAVHEGLKLQGFARLQIREGGPNGTDRIVSDTGILGPNQKTNIGMLNFIAYMLAASAGSTPVAFAAVGTGGTPASNAASLGGESALAGTSRSPTTLSINGSTQLQWIASWASNAAGTLWSVGNAGLYGHSSTNSLICGISTPTQTWASNQTLALTYQLNLTQ